MAWVTPVYNRTAGARMTATDMDRICGNINFLNSNSALPTGWTANDIVTVDDWSDILAALERARKALGYTTSIKPTKAQTYQNVNNIEKLTAQLKAHADLLTLQKAAIVYTGDGTYTSDTPENWVRD